MAAAAARASGGGGAGSAEDKAFHAMMIQSAKLGVQTARRLRIVESAVFEYLLCYKEWWPLVCMKKCCSEYEKNLDACKNGKERKAIHRTPKHLYCWAEIVKCFCDKHEDKTKIPELTCYADDVTKRPWTIRREVKVLMRLDIPESKQVRLQVRIERGTLAEQVWFHLCVEALQEGLIKNDDGKDETENAELFGTAPRSKSEKAVLKHLWQQGAIGDPKLGAADASQPD